MIDVDTEFGSLLGERVGAQQGLKVTRYPPRMLTFYNSTHAEHAAAFEIFRGNKVPAFERPERVDTVAARLRERGHALAPVDSGRAHDASAVMAQVHSARYLAFLASAWQQWVALDPANAQAEAFPSVWPVRTLRSDIEPDNFTAKLGLYSMDNGAPILAGTWAAVKGGAHAAHSAAWAVASGWWPCQSAAHTGNDVDPHPALNRASSPALNPALNPAPRAAFCLSRPPGHHAGADFMGGYCFINQAAIAAQTLRNAGAARVVILDVDYHHGNGTQSIFYDRADVQFISLHGDPRTEYPFYLGHADETGTGAGRGFNLNLPLPAGCSPQTWFAALDTACARIRDYAPQALVVSLGLDTFAGDPITHINLTAPDFTRLGQVLAGLGLPTVFVFEGGYANAELAVNTVNVLEGFDSKL